MKHSATRKFLSESFRVYRSNMYPTNTALAAAVAFGLASNFSTDLVSFETEKAPPPPVNVGSPIGQVKGVPIAKRVSFHTSGQSLSDITDSWTPVATPSFSEADYPGIQAMFQEVDQSLKRPYKFVSNSMTKEFGVTPYKMDQETLDAMYYASNLTGIDVGILFAFASKESNFRRDAQANTSSASGLFQITTATCRNIIKKLGQEWGYGDLARQIGTDGDKTWFKTNHAKREAKRLCDTPKDAALLTAILLLDNKRRVESKIGRSLRPIEYYVAHFFGEHGASAFLRATDRMPSARVNKVAAMHDAIGSNQSIFISQGKYKTFGQVYGWFDDQMSKRYAYFEAKYGKNSVVPEQVASVEAAGSTKP